MDCQDLKACKVIEGLESSETSKNVVMVFFYLIENNSVI